MFAPPAHLDDGTAVRLLDRELSTTEHAAILGHVNGCAACASRVDELAAVSDRVRVTLARATPAPPIPGTRRGEGPRLATRPRRALRSVPFAIAASAVMVAAAVPMVRARLAPVAFEVPRVSGNAGPAAPAGGALRVLEFDPGGLVLSVEVSGSAAGGTLALTAHGGRRVVLEADGPPGRAIWVAPGVLRLTAPSHGVGYRVLVPGSVRLVHVSIDGTRVETVTGPRLGQGAVRVTFP